MKRGRNKPRKKITLGTKVKKEKPIKTSGIKPVKQKGRKRG